MKEDNPKGDNSRDVIICAELEVLYVI